MKNKLIADAFVAKLEPARNGWRHRLHPTTPSPAALLLGLILASSLAVLPVLALGLGARGAKAPLQARRPVGDLAD